jgi:hypothetical protein
METGKKKQGKLLKTLEKLHICKISNNRPHMNDAYVDIYNPVFETLQELIDNSTHILYKIELTQLSKHL